MGDEVQDKTVPLGKINKKLQNKNALINTRTTCADSKYCSTELHFLEGLILKIEVSFMQAESLISYLLQDNILVLNTNLTLQP
jgi:hypothetical protein